MSESRADRARREQCEKDARRRGDSAFYPDSYDTGASTTPSYDSGSSSSCDSSSSSSSSSSDSGSSSCD